MQINCKNTPEHSQCHPNVIFDEQSVWSVYQALKGISINKKCQKSGQGRPPHLFISPTTNTVVTPFVLFFVCAPKTSGYGTGVHIGAPNDYIPTL
jgi:hypothetical protein